YKPAMGIGPVQNELAEKAILAVEVEADASVKAPRRIHNLPGRTQGNAHGEAEIAVDFGVIVGFTVVLGTEGHHTSRHQQGNAEEILLTVQPLHLVRPTVTAMQ